MPTPTFHAKWWAVVFWPFAQLYGAAIRIRNALFDWGILRSEGAPCHVISIGGLTVGGSGKTPATLFLARHWAAQGKKVAILSRGYRRRSRGPVVVSDGTRILATAPEAGDEPVLLARRLNGVVVLVDKNRRRALRLACQRFQAQVVLLDDGFQHRSVQRQEDHVLVSAASGFGNGHLLPAGPLREPPSSLARASHVWITKVSDLRTASTLVKQIRRHSAARICFARHRPIRFERWPTGEELPVSFVRGKRVLCFAGIAEPEPFFQMVAELGARVQERMALPDHVAYTPRRLKALAARAVEAGAEMLITTDKDAVKLARGEEIGPPLLSLIIDFVPTAGPQEWDDASGPISCIEAHL